MTFPFEHLSFRSKQKGQHHIVMALAHAAEALAAMSAGDVALADGHTEAARKHAHAARLFADVYAKSVRQR